MSKDLDGMKEAAGDYYRYALEARREYLSLLSETDEEIATLYREHLRQILTEYRSGRNGGLVYLLDAIDEDSPKFHGDLAARIENAIEKGAAAGILFSKSVTIDCLSKTGMSAGPMIRAFEWQRKQAVAACYARTHKDGLYLSDRIWNTSEETRKAMKAIVQAGIGEDAVKVARALEMYVKQGKTAACLQFPNMMERMGSRVPENLDYNALRLARTELTAAYGAATVGAAQASPAISKLKWVLSSGHPREDICDTYAEGGDGHGVYDAGRCPNYPAHPNCLCNLQPMPDNPEDFARKMKEWLDKPSSHPDIEAWYKKNYKMFEAPNDEKTTLPNDNEKAIIEAATLAKVDMLKKEIDRVSREMYQSTNQRYIELDNQLNAIYKQLETAKVEAAKNGIILTSGLERNYGKAEIEIIKEKLKAAPKDIRIVWNRFEGDMLVIDTNLDTKKKGNGPHYSPGRRGIFLNLAEDKTKKDSTPFHTTFHEIGHLIDHFVGKKSYFASHRYNGDIFANTIRAEASDYITKTWSRLKMSALVKGKSAKKIMKQDAYDAISDEIYGLGKAANRRDVSDIWHGATRGKVDGGYGHKVSYWNDSENLPTEAFAEMFSATINNPKAVENIKKYFPKSYEIFERMIKEIAERGTL